MEDKRIMKFLLVGTILWFLCVGSVIIVNSELYKSGSSCIVLNTGNNIVNVYEDKYAKYDNANYVITYKKSNKKLNTKDINFSIDANDRYYLIWKSFTKDNNNTICKLWEYPYKNKFVSYLCVNNMLKRETVNGINNVYTTPLNKWKKTKIKCKCS